MFSDLLYEHIDEVQNDTTFQNAPDIYSWSCASKSKYEGALNSPEVKKKIEHLNSIIESHGMPV